MFFIPCCSLWYCATRIDIVPTDYCTLCPKTFCCYSFRFWMNALAAPLPCFLKTKHEHGASAVVGFHRAFTLPCLIV